MNERQAARLEEAEEEALLSYAEDGDAGYACGSLEYFTMWQCYLRYRYWQKQGDTDLVECYYEALNNKYLAQTGDLDVHVPDFMEAQYQKERKQNKKLTSQELHDKLWKKHGWLV